MQVPVKIEKGTWNVSNYGKNVIGSALIERRTRRINNKMLFTNRSGDGEPEQPSMSQHVADFEFTPKQKEYRTEVEVESIEGDQNDGIHAFQQFLCKESKKIMDNTDSPDNVKRVRRRSMEKRKHTKSRSPKKPGLNRLFEPRRCRRCAGCRAIEKQNLEKLI